MLAVPTADRPANLARLLASLSKRDLRDQDVNLLVVDDSRRPANSERTASLAAGHGGQVSDRAHRARVADHLSMKLQVDPAILRQALLGDESTATYGAAQNSVLWHTQGKLVLAIDDDVMVDRAVSLTPDVDVPRDHHPEGLWFYERPDEVPCGAPLRFSLLLQKLTAAFHDQTPDQQTAVAVLGLVGDPGTASSANMMTPANAITAHNCLLSDAQYRRSRQSRHVVRVAPGDAKRPMSAFMTAAYAVANDMPLIPFFPSYRGSDAIFGDVLSAAFPHYRLHFVPLALPHAPSESRSFEEDHATVRFSTVVLSILAHAVPSEAGSLEAVLTALVDFVSHDQRHLEARLLDALRHHRARLIANLEMALATAPEPDLRVRDIVAQITRLQCADHARQLSILEGPRGSEAAQLIRHQILSWSRACELWPALAQFDAKEVDRECRTAKTPLSRPPC